MGWGGLNSGTLADRLKVGRGVIDRIFHGETTPSSDRLIAIADACGVPHRFMLEGWDALRPDEPDFELTIEDRLARVETTAQHTAAAMTRVQRTVRALEQALDDEP